MNADTHNLFAVVNNLVNKLNIPKMSRSSEINMSHFGLQLDCSAMEVADHWNNRQKP